MSAGEALGSRPATVRALDALYAALAFAGVGAIVGQGLAAYRFERNRRANTTRIVFAWTLFGFVAGWLVVLFVLRLSR